MSIYTAEISDGMSRNAGGTTVFSAVGLAQAIEHAEEWVRAGEYPGPCVVTWYLTDPAAGETTEHRTIID